MKSVEIVSISLPIELLHAIDHHRHDISRSKFVQRLIENGFEALCKSNVAQQKDFANVPSYDKVTEDNNVLRKDTETKTREIGTAKNSPISWLNR